MNLCLIVVVGETIKTIVPVGKVSKRNVTKSFCKGCDDKNIVLCQFCVNKGGYLAGESSAADKDFTASSGVTAGSDM